MTTATSAPLESMSFWMRALRSGVCRGTRKSRHSETSSEGIGLKCSLEGMRDLAGSSVIVGGAGLAGLSAARALEARGASGDGHRSARPRGRAGVDAARRVRRAAACRSGRRPHRRRPGAPADARQGARAEARADPARRIRLLRPRRARPAASAPAPDRVRRGRQDVEGRGRGVQAGGGTLGQRRRGQVRPDLGVGLARGAAARRRRSRPPCAASGGSFSPIPKTCRCCRWWSSSPKAACPAGSTPSASPAATIASPPGSRNACADRFCKETIVRRVVQRADGVTVTIDDRRGRRSEITADYFVCALPASTAREVVFEPGAARAAARRDGAPPLRLRDAAGAAVRAALLEEARTPARVRHRSADRRHLGRQRAGARPAGDAQLPGRRPRVERAAGHPGA